jgi:hypothetical protein
MGIQMPPPEDAITHPEDVPDEVSALDIVKQFAVYQRYTLDGLEPGPVSPDRACAALSALASATAARERLLAQCWPLAVLVLRIGGGLNMIAAAMHLSRVEVATSLVEWSYRGRGLGVIAEADHQALIDTIREQIARDT